MNEGKKKETTDVIKDIKRVPTPKKSILQLKIF